MRMKNKRDNNLQLPVWPTERQSLSRQIVSWTIAIGIFLSFPWIIADANAQTKLKQEHPDRYTVKKGDTLWDIASHFLNDPWRWPLIWIHNPKIKNPHLIYPGDLLVATSDGITGAGSVKVIRNKPRIRRTPIKKAIPTIPPHVIQPFLDGSLVLKKGELDLAGHVVIGVKDELVLGKPQKFYARNLTDQSADEYRLFRVGQKLVEPKTGELLGIEAIHLGDAIILKRDKIAKLQIIDSVREILPGDRLVPVVGNKQPIPYYHPRAPDKEISAWIIHAPAGVKEVGRYDVIILSAGEREGIEEGHVLKAMNHRDIRKDPVDNKTYQLPDEQAGLIMVFRVFEKVSYALVMRATTEIKVGDRAITP